MEERQPQGCLAARAVRFAEGVGAIEGSHVGLVHRHLDQGGGGDRMAHLTACDR